MDVNAHLNGATIGAAREKFTKAKPTGNGAAQFCDPDRVLLWGMRAEPFAAALDRDPFKLCSGNTAGYGSIMNFDDRRQIGFDGIANNDAFNSGGLWPTMSPAFIDQASGHRPPL